MKCDHTGCKAEPIRAPRVIVPYVGWPAPIPGFTPLRMMTTLHYCQPHVGELKAEDILTAKVKADFEDMARAKRPLGFKCDFEAAFVEYLLVTTPEYRDFLDRLDVGRLLRRLTAEAS
ncbi:MAG TPA: hypothetical protein VNT30_09365 [Stellaceae bacterium]|nr:hypothetical protein [Stellaceae bacterium]